MKNRKYSKKYGSICLSCGRTSPIGLNSDGECARCVADYNIINEYSSFISDGKKGGVWILT